MHNHFDNNEYSLRVNDLSYRYSTMKDVWAIRNINMVVKYGEFIAVIGQNGSGKTTMAKCISGFLQPKIGEIYICSNNLRDIHPSKHARHIGYIFQNPDHQLFKDTVWEEVTFGMKNLGVDSAELQARGEDIITRLGLSQYRDLHPHRLSKGDKQRLAVAAVAVMEPSIIVVDEPTTGQDPQRARHIMDMLRDMNQEKGITVLTITHDMELVAEYAMRTIVLCAGQKLLDCPVREAFSQPEILKQSFIEPPFVSRLGVEIGIKPIPLSISEAADYLLEKIKE